jgi:hypothetical protein
MAFAVAVMLLEDRPVYTPDEAKPRGETPPDTLAWRVEQWNRKESIDDWDDTTLFDVSSCRTTDGFLD